MFTIATPAGRPFSTLNRYSNLVSNFAIFLVFSALCHHAFYCFINTHFFSISSSILVLTELFFVGIVFLFFISKVQMPYLILIIFILSNAFILAVFQQGLDPKHIRNFIIPVLMVWLGAEYNGRIAVDTLVKWMAWIFLIFGLFELIFIDLFQEIFNVLQYQISMGRASERTLEYASGSFSANGTRYGGRNLLPFIGDHRVASVFLETVNTSNFSTLLAGWGLSKKTLKEGALFFLIGLVVATLSDSRFGVTLIILMFILRFSLNVNLLKIAAYFSPIFALMVCFYLGWDFAGFRDDFETRLGSTGDYILKFEPLELFGLSSYHYAGFLDQGYARLLHYNGIVLMVVMWITMCRLRFEETKVHFKLFVAMIIAANLAVSGDSVFAFKWASIMWFLVGTCLYKTKAV